MGFKYFIIYFITALLLVVFMEARAKYGYYPTPSMIFRAVVLTSTYISTVIFFIYLLLDEWSKSIKSSSKFNLKGLFKSFSGVAVWALTVFIVAKIYRFLFALQ